MKDTPFLAAGMLCLLSFCSERLERMRKPILWILAWQVVLLAASLAHAFVMSMDEPTRAEVKLGRARARLTNLKRTDAQELRKEALRDFKRLRKEFASRGSAWAPLRMPQRCYQEMLDLAVQIRAQAEYTKRMREAASVDCVKMAQEKLQGEIALLNARAEMARIWKEGKNFVLDKESHLTSYLGCLQCV